MRNKLAFFLPLLLLAITGCEHPARPDKSEPNFTRYQPIHFNVNTIDIVDEYESPMGPPNVEHLIPTSPSEAMHTWVKERMRAVGTSNTMEVIIKDASVVSTPFGKPGSMFTVSHAGNSYDARLSVEIRIYGGNDAMSQASIHVSATQSTSIEEKASLAQRKAIFNKMIFDLMENINAELEKNIYQYFGNYIIYSRGV